MIDIKRMIEAYDSDKEVKIVCTDGEVIIGRISSVDDEEESGLGEIGCSLFTPDRRYLGIGISEIDEIIIRNK